MTTVAVPPSLTSFITLCPSSPTPETISTSISLFLPISTPCVTRYLTSSTSPLKLSRGVLEPDLDEPRPDALLAPPLPIILTGSTGSRHARALADEVVPPQEAVRPPRPRVEEPGGAARQVQPPAPRSVRPPQVLEARQLHEHEGHALDYADGGGVELGVADGLVDVVVEGCLDTRGEGRVALPLVEEERPQGARVDVDVVRDGGQHATAAVAAAAAAALCHLGDADGPGGRDDGVDEVPAQVPQEQVRGADGGVPREGELPVRGEDADLPGAGGAVRALQGLARPEVEEGRLGEVELARDELPPPLVQQGVPLPGLDDDHREGVAELLPPHRVLGQHPAPAPLGLPLLGQLRLRHPVVLGQRLPPGPLGRGPDLRPPVCVARGEDIVTGEHAETPEREACRHGHISACSHGPVLAAGGQVDHSVGARGRELAARNLEEAEVRRALGAVSHDNQLDLGQDEAVPAAVLAHDVVQVRQASEVLDLLDVALDAHARVEAVEALDEADDARAGLAAKDGGRRGCIAGHSRHEHLLAVAGGVRARLGGDGELQGPVGAQAQGGVELGKVPVRVDGMQIPLRLWVPLRAHGVGQEGLRNGAVEEARRRTAGEGHDGRCVEGAPWSDLPDIPPEVLDLRISQREGDGAHKARCGIRGGEVAKEACCRGGSKSGWLEGLDRLEGLWLGCEAGSDQGR
ncbi:hypothetical protein VPNG_00219 [Cytospora leucostoma]|uniref:Uncharacterized protein n=1 Tax=Cytospora leucostoma TaxID=1230097 RepID=A0A423XMX7_9PEZI|nr:hypothetical protein VPNG_00219 [Cytospora leucostoma]